MDKELSRDYNVADFNTDGDWRFEYAKKDCIFIHTLYWIDTIIAFIAAYALCPSDPTQIKFILGMPLWFVASAGICCVGFIIAIIYFVMTKQFTFTPRMEEAEQ